MDCSFTKRVNQKPYSKPPQAYGISVSLYLCARKIRCSRKVTEEFRLRFVNNIHVIPTRPAVRLVSGP